MVFVVERTSLWGDEKPCDEAYRKKFKCWQTRTCSEEEFNNRFSEREGLWRSKGKNHTVTDKGYITRQIEDQEAWAIKFNNLNELMEFVVKHGQVIISEEDFSVKAPSIEIYDDYRE